MIFADNETLGLALLVRAVLYAMAFFFLSIVVFGTSTEKESNPSKKAFVRLGRYVCYLLTAINIFMAFDWFFVYFSE